MQKRATIITICLFAVIIAAIVLVFNGGLPGGKPPELKVSNELNNTITAQQGTYSWQSGRGHIIADSMGPLGLYKLGELKGIEPSENDDYSLSLKFGKNPESVAVVIYPESAATTEDNSTMISRPVSGPLSGYKFTVPSDGIYIVNVHATWSKGDCYYYFYTTP